MRDVALEQPIDVEQLNPSALRWQVKMIFPLCRSIQILQSAIAWSLACFSVLKSYLLFMRWIFSTGSGKVVEKTIPSACQRLVPSAGAAAA